MIRNPLLEMSLLEAKKETDNKLRWDVDVEGTKFELYIPKWRIPEPWPSRIWVGVSPRRSAGDELPNLTREDVQSDGSLRHEPIVATVDKVSVHTATIKYQSTGNESTWEIGTPYVPFSLTGGRSERLRLIVLWDLTSRGMFLTGAEAGE